MLELDKGEKHTLDMACQMNADYVIIDEKIGRNLAEYLGLNVTGTLGILLAAKKQGLIDSFTDYAMKMRGHCIYYHPSLVAKLATQIGK